MSERELTANPSVDHPSVGAPRRVSKMAVAAAAGVALSGAILGVAPTPVMISARQHVYTTATVHV